jgi:hypothetical protein
MKSPTTAEQLKIFAQQFNKQPAFQLKNNKTQGIGIFDAKYDGQDDGKKYRFNIKLNGETDNLCTLSVGETQSDDDESVLGDEETVESPPELNKNFLESFATSITNNFSANNCKNITVSYIGSKNESCDGLGAQLFCGQFFQYSLSITINGSKINTAENNECGEKNEKSQCGEKNDSDFFYIPVNEMKEIQKTILKKEDTGNYYIKTFKEWYFDPIIKYGTNNYQYTLNIEFKVDNKLCCTLNPLPPCSSNNPFAALGDCSQTNPPNLQSIPICGSC